MTKPAASPCPNTVQYLINEPATFDVCVSSDIKDAESQITMSTVCTAPFTFSWRFSDLT